MKKISETAKLINRFLRVFFWIAAAAGIAALVILIAMLFVDPCSLVDTGFLSVTLGMAEVHLRAGLDIGEARSLLGWLLAALILCAAFTCYVIRLLGKLFRPMENGTPFDQSVSKLLRKLAWLVLVCGIVLTGIQTVILTQIYHVFDVPGLFDAAKVSSCVLSIKTDGSFIVGFALLYLLSHIFRYGEELQQLSDETL